jgi:hypothetical protein
MKEATLAVVAGLFVFVACWIVALALLPSAGLFPAGGVGLVLALLAAESVRDSLE